MEKDYFLGEISNYLRKNFQTIVENRFLKIITPFLAYNEEHINIFVKRVNEKDYQLSDGGSTMSNLASINCDLSGINRDISDKLQRLYGFQIKNGEIISTCNPNDLGETLINHILAQLSLLNLEFRIKC